MNALEIPEIEGLVRLQNPEIGADYIIESAPYSLQDVARKHAETISALKLSPDQSFTVIGMSMGGMVALIMASLFRHMLPSKTRFRIIVSSPNFPINPAISDERLKSWLSVKSGNAGDFSSLLAPFFSSSFRASQSKKVQEYIRYRAAGENLQSPKAFLRQVNALRSFNISYFLRSINPRELDILNGGDDSIIDQSHYREFLKIFESARAQVISDMGHMANLEKPCLFRREVAL